ncbi:MULTISPECIES: phytanoyl-CoA dioxygenase family protein [unclassified Roseofilum]|uniref:phytanoyl-CoA dioxygenase family protein n=1 Tax=unclassified Roseofilum TaxID=2620099 RepID=UPI000E9DE3DD|nr:MULTISPECIES: phytanoyl-CoA dioxygenase family protein [unclassified Roseofilum]MBP0007678.1 phytanoyl-CoA dioxygenase family protein [Roseofilum sp. Belize Diploria]MBP0032424.1 phytanoyl-CoA dioxygenase family protein [Roseofilum sp. Belize BBD 4]HBQ97865.1 hypothetical protein [Cyanobacteria bacterium UBA11691]
MKTLNSPPLSNTLEEARKHFEEFGFALIANALSPDEVKEAKERLIEQAEAERQAGVAMMDSGATFDPNGPNQRVWSLITKGEIFRKIAVKEAPLNLIRDRFAATNDGPMPEPFAGEALLSSLSANIACKGGSAMPLHFDQGYLPVTPYPMVINMMWMLSDFTEENGATLMVPGSHKLQPQQAIKGQAIPVPEEAPEPIPAVAPAGTAMVFDGRLWHGTGANKTDDPRYGILAYYCRPFMRQQEHFWLTLDWEEVKDYAPELKELLGLKMWGPLGMAGNGKDGTIQEVGAPVIREMHL